MISQRSIQEVLNTAHVEHIIEEYVNLKRRGVNLIGLCPFHDEKTPSFTVSPSKNIYKCFGCGKGGGAVQFLMDHDHLSFPESIRTLAAKYNIELEEDNREDDDAWKEQKNLEESYYIINEFAGDYYQDKLFNSNDGQAIAMSYFKERGFLDQTLKQFKLGYSPDESKGLTEKAIAKQFKEDYLKEIGLTSKNGYDFFRNRVMFPIHNVSGKIIAFAGRTLSTSKSQPKYINSPETPIYNKRKVLYAMHLAKGEIRKQENCYIVEGYTDVISLFQNGVKNVVASSGTALTTEQVRLVKRYTENITFLYDGDPAGIKAAMRGLDIVLENDMNVKLVLLPEGEDPDSFMKKSGSQEFQNYLEQNAKDFIYFKMDLLLEEAGDDPVKRSKLINNIIGSISKLRDPIKRSLYTRQCALRMEIDEKILIREINKAIKENIRQKRLERERQERSQLPPEINESDFIAEEKIHHQQQKFETANDIYQEKDLARIIVNAGDKIIKNENGTEIIVADFIYSNIHEVIGYFDDPMLKQIIEEGFKFVESGDGGQTLNQYFVHHKDDKIRQFSIDNMQSPYNYANWEDKGVYLQTQKMPEENYFRDSLQSILRFKHKKIKAVLEQLQKRINTLAREQKYDELQLNLKAHKQLSEEKKIVADKLGTVVS
ncbi:MAG: DNA primase [Saprospiraceae bacterium]|nr:DNA primase [Saprospiraceae bacterium]